MSRLIYEYPDPICMICGEECETWECVATWHKGSPDQLWCYCKPCDVDTFHPGRPIQ
jgi:hypothetical protein